MGRFPPELKRAAGQQQSCFIKHPSQDALEVHAGAGSQMMPMTLLDMMYDFSVSPRGDTMGPNNKDLSPHWCDDAASESVKETRAETRQNVPIHEVELRR